MTVFGSKVLKAYVILMWSGAVPWWGGGGGERRGHGVSPPPPQCFFFVCVLSAKSPVLYIDDQGSVNLNPFPASCLYESRGQQARPRLALALFDSVSINLSVWLFGPVAVHWHCAVESAKCSFIITFNFNSVTLKLTKHANWVTFKGTG